MVQYDRIVRRAIALLVLALLASCHQREQAIRSQANAQVERANAEAAREKRYESCDEPRPESSLCGLLSPQFFTELNIRQIVETDCKGVVDELCREHATNTWIQLLERRYPRADAEQALAPCKAGQACDDPVVIERLLLASHNAAVEAWRVAQGAAIAGNADAELEADRRVRLQAFGKALQAGGQSLSGGTDSRPQVNGEDAQSRTCTSDYGCPGGWHCMKDSRAMSGICAKGVNRVGVPTYSPPDPASVGAGTGQCSFNTQCPLGFKCVKTSGGLRGNCLR